MDKPANFYRVVKRNRKSVKEHRLVMAQALGRELLPSEHVHHLNEAKTDNRTENLEVMERGPHSSLHHRLMLDTDRIKTLRTSGMTISEIAKEMGVSRKPIKRLLDESGVDSSTRVISWDLGEALKMVSAGFSRESIATALGVSSSGLRKVFRNRGIVCADMRNKVSYDFVLIDSMLSDGLSLRKIAKSCGCSYSGLRSELIRTGRLNT